jgi:hypothetical protein
MDNICEDRVAPEKQDFLACLPRKLHQGTQLQEVVSMETPAETEQWKEISGFEGIYQISNHGRLKKLKGYARDMGYPRLVSVKHKGGWYLTVTLRHGPKRWTVRIHVLVAQAFVPNFESKPEVNHKDLNKQNNYADNLEWVTKKENVIHAVFHKPEIVCAMNYYNQFVRPKTIEQLSFDGKIIESSGTAKKRKKQRAFVREIFYR